MQLDGEFERLGRQKTYGRLEGMECNGHGVSPGVQTLLLKDRVCPKCAIEKRKDGVTGLVRVV